MGSLLLTLEVPTSFGYTEALDKQLFPNDGPTGEENRHRDSPNRYGGSTIIVYHLAEVGQDLGCHRIIAEVGYESSNLSDS